MNKMVCSIDGCQNIQRARGWCPTHWRRWRHNGDPEVVKLVRHGSPEKTIEANTEWRGSCLEWTGAVGNPGYARLTVDGVRELAHRYVWQKANGPILGGAFIDHICHNRRCLNIEHLRLATPAQNTYNRNGAGPGRKYDLPRNVYPTNTRGGREPSSYYVLIGGDRVGTYYSTPEEAAVVAEAGRREMYGDFAGLG